MNDQVIKLLLDMGHSAEEARAVAAALDQVEQSATKAAGKGGAGGQGILAASYAIQDFTSQLGTTGLAGGLRAIQNNIPQMLAGLGLGAGLTGVISAAATGVGLLIDNFDKLKASFTAAATKTEAEAMKELEENTHRTADQTDRLNKYKERQAELQKILAAQTKDQKAQQSVYEEFFGGGRGEAILGGTAQAIGAAGRGAVMTEEETGTLAAGEREIAMARQLSPSRVPALEAAQQAYKDKVQERINKANMAQAGKLLGEAPTAKGAGARATLQALGRQFPGAFPEGFAGDLASLEGEPARQRAQEARREADKRVRSDTEAKNRAMQQEADNDARIEKDKQRRREADNREAEALNRQGQALEERAERDRDRARAADQRQVRQAVQREDRGPPRDRGTIPASRLAALDAQSIQRHLAQLETIDLSSKNQAQQQQLMARFRQLQLSLQRIQTQFPNAMAGLPN